MKIDRCVCENRTFSELALVARREELRDAEGLAAATGCGTHCGLCVAYVRRMLVTGETVFREILPKEELRERPEIRDRTPGVGDPE
jgi:bacterioferritin-associated ferredoxin